jgi:Sulfotransferase family
MPDGQEYIAPVSSARFVLLHYHIFKNAGSTIEYAMRRFFGKRFATLHGPGPNSILSGEDMAAFLTSHPEIAAISSHHVKYPKPVAPGVIIFDLCVLRDPLERLRSVYQHFRRAEPVDELSARAKEMDLPSFLDLLIRQYPHMVNDAQVNALANAAAYTRPPDSTDLGAALQIVREMSVISMVDLFDESIVAAEYFLCPAFPSIQLEYFSQNVSPKDAEPFRDAVGTRIYQQLEKMNQLDGELVSRARAEVRRRFELVPDAEERLAGFRRRCAELAEAPSKVIAG